MNILPEFSTYVFTYNGKYYFTEMGVNMLKLSELIMLYQKGTWATKAKVRSSLLEMDQLSSCFPDTTLAT